MKNVRTFLVAALAVGATSTAAHANAFYLSEHDAEATGRGFANAASDDEPSSIVYNPGGVALGTGTAISLGGSLVIADASFTPDGGAKYSTTTGPQVLPQLYVTSRLTDLVAVGVGFYAPFGLAIDWPETAPTSDVIEHQSLRTYYISPVVGLNLNKYVPGLSIGGGVDIVPSTVELTQAIYLGADRGSAHLGGTATGIGGRAGIQYRPPQVPMLSVGVMWRSSVKENYTGTGDFDSPPQYRATLPPDGPISTSITMPQSISGGVQVRPTHMFEIEADFSWVDWSSFQQLVLTLPDGSTQNVQENYQNETTFRLGAEVHLPGDQISVRAGYIYDPTPIQPQYLTVALPDANRNDVTLGATYKACKQLAVAVGLLYVLPTSRSTEQASPYQPEYAGKFDISAFVASLSVRGRFGGASEAHD
jgi:long-chain fatty acid transport protein